MVVPSNVDIATTEALSMAQEVDPDGDRTIGERLGAVRVGPCVQQGSTAQVHLRLEPAGSTGRQCSWVTSVTWGHSSSDVRMGSTGTQSDLSIRGLGEGMWPWLPAGAALPLSPGQDSGLSGILISHKQGGEEPWRRCLGVSRAVPQRRAQEQL